MAIATLKPPHIGKEAPANILLIGVQDKNIFWTDKENDRKTAIISIQWTIQPIVRWHFEEHKIMQMRKS